MPTENGNRQYVSTCSLSSFLFFEEVLFWRAVLWTIFPIMSPSKTKYLRNCGLFSQKSRYCLTLFSQIRVCHRKKSLHAKIQPFCTTHDQYQFSPNNINTSSRETVMRITGMITKGKLPWSFIKFSQLSLQGNVWRSGCRIYNVHIGAERIKAKLSHASIFIHQGP